jgi:hypothetical protein
MTCQTVRIFLASSFELAEHRHEFELFIGRQNKLLVERGVFLKLVMWEDFIDAMSATRLQNEYNKALKECELFVMLFRTKVGKYTAEEFEKAFGQFKQTGRPLVWTYFNNTPVKAGQLNRAELNSLFYFQDKLLALGHFKTDYDNQDALCRHFGEQLAKLESDGFFKAKAETGPSQEQLPTLEQELHRYLEDRLASEFSDRTERYVPLAGQRRESRSPRKGRKNLRFAPRMEHRTPAECGGYGEPVPCYDVLTAYRHLPADRQPRLAVLGEPGAGKSFSLERLFCALAEALLEQPLNSTLPAPLLLRLGDWTRASETLDEFLADHLREHGSALLAQHWPELRRQRPLVLLLDAYNEIPVGQRLHKAAQLQEMAGDTRWAAVVVSCRERDFTQELVLPFDTLTLQPLTPPQVLEFLERWEGIDHEPATARVRAEEQFWRLAAGDEAQDARAVWLKWQQAGASFDLFWQAEHVPRKEPNVYGQTSGNDYQLWRRIRSNPRSLLRLAGSPFWLSMLVERGLIDGAVLSNRLALVDEFLASAHADGERLHKQQQALDQVPDLPAWAAALQALALALQHGAAAEQINRPSNDETDGGAQTRLPREQALAILPAALLEFSISVQVLKESSGQVHFHHQLLQEALAARALLDACAADPQGARAYWPPTHWWQRNGWEMVAELAAESLGDDVVAACRLVAWLAEAQPEVALRAWQAAGSPALPDAVREHLRQTWLPAMTDPAAWPCPEARAAIGRAMAGFDLDNRPGTGLRSAGVPDIDWVVIDDDRPFIYQKETHPPLPAYRISRYPVTNRQWQAFVDDGGYADERWWNVLSEHQEPMSPRWTEPTAPRVTVNWFEAMAYCRWLSVKLGGVVTLPTEAQWERAARGVDGRDYPWGNTWWPRDTADAMCQIGRTSLVGTYPENASPDGVEDMVGNVEELCLSEYDGPPGGTIRRRVVRGSSWGSSRSDWFCRTDFRYMAWPADRRDFLGFRLVSCPITGTEP